MVGRGLLIRGALLGILPLAGCAASGTESGVAALTAPVPVQIETAEKSDRVDPVAEKGDRLPLPVTAPNETQDDGKSLASATADKDLPQLALLPTKASTPLPSHPVKASSVNSMTQTKAPIHLAAFEPLGRDETKRQPFSAKLYGVSASPRLAYGTDQKQLRRGGGYYKVGEPYQIKGRIYTPKDQPDYTAEGKASWYGDAFHGRKTANGEVYDMNHLSAAHPTLPLPSYARVTNLKNGSSVIVRINDRGPYSGTRIIDVSKRAAHMLGYKKAGVADVRVEYIGKAPLEGADDDYLMASYQPPKDADDTFHITDTIATLVASASQLPVIGSVIADNSDKDDRLVLTRFAREEGAEQLPDAKIASLIQPDRVPWHRFAAPSFETH